MTPSEFVTSGAVNLAVYRWQNDDAERPVVVLIHGYPDNASIWEPLATQLAEDFTVIAYDTRGAGLSSAPSGIESYAAPHLVSDLAAVIYAVSPQQPVHLVAYDWGALPAWEAVARADFDGRIASLTTAAPSADQLGQWFRGRLTSRSPVRFLQGLRQVAASSYMLLFQLPKLPEMTWRLGLGRHWPRFVNLVEGTEAPAHPNQTADGIQGLNLYRANLRRLLRPHVQPVPTAVPVQLLLLQRDRFLPIHLFENLEQSASNLRRTQIDAGHWAMLSHTRQLANAITPFVTSIEDT
ncbi:alpha/beta fold hydrolase [Isoalcanivorax beigongshangi]|uniref:Alpha/beta fold hydrolase n=1 Tax=Isoalcanivorax beigongshangi TaxID=3238810 RepID=A0ABV4AFJ3_9GAMM